MFKTTLPILFKFICNTVSFELFSRQRSFYLVKRSEFDHIIDSLHSTQVQFYIRYITLVVDYITNLHKEAFIVNLFKIEIVYHRLASFVKIHMPAFLVLICPA